MFFRFLFWLLGVGAMSAARQSAICLFLHKLFFIPGAAQHQIETCSDIQCAGIEGVEKAEQVVSYGVKLNSPAVPGKTQSYV